MNKKFMLLGLCAMGAFSAVQADEPANKTTDTTTVSQDTTVASTTKDTATTVSDTKDSKDKEDCGCGTKR